MRRVLVPFVLLTGMATVPVAAQQPAAARDTASHEAAAPVPKEESSATDHVLRIGAQVVPYRATAATMLLKNDKGEPIGSLYYTAYTRTDARDASPRPITFAYHGGPGSASA